MSEPCEIYVRHSSGSDLVHIYGGATDFASPNMGGELVAFVDLSSLPEWMTVADKHSGYEESGELIHVRIPFYSASDFRLGA